MSISESDNGKGRYQNQKIWMPQGKSKSKQQKKTKTYQNMKPRDLDNTVNPKSYGSSSRLSKKLFLNFYGAKFL